MSKVHPKSTADAPGKTLPEGGTDVTRAELRRLKRALERVQGEFSDTRAAQLMEANQQLVLTALQAETIAETATVKLHELTRAFQRDPLTDTPNRALMLDRLQNAIAMAKRHESHIAVLFVDIDHFKTINDTHGHSIGDEVLQLVARRLQAAVRDSDTVSRHSGDEFVVLLAEVSHASDAALIATKMLAAIVGPANSDALPFPVSASIGVAIYPDDGEDAATLIGRADRAMYRSKRMGGGTFQFHSDEPSPDDIAEPPLASNLLLTGHDEPDLTPHHGYIRNLRDANEQLVLSSLAAHEMEARAAQTRHRQAKFLAMVAHELRNPLAPIRLAADLLNRARADEKQHAWLQQIIQRQAGHMARIVEDLLDGARVDTGKFHLERATVELTSVLNLALDSCRPAMEAKQQHLGVQLPDGVLAMNGDPVRLAQIFRNLLDNATKYTANGGAISISATMIDDAVVVTVSDNGIGIAGDILPRVFDLFVQDPRAITVHTGGLGIGLAVVRELVEAHGGSVVAKSAGLDLGSEFVVTLPMVACGSAP